MTRMLLGPILALLLAGLAAAPAAAQFADPDAYCLPESAQYDPADVKRPDAPPVELPPGATMRRITVAGFTTVAIEMGPQEATEAIVFMHGNPGNSLDYLRIMRAVPPGTRAIAFDILGFGNAEKPWDFPFTLEASRPLIDRAFDDLRVERMHLVGHDFGSVAAVDWAARHPDRLASAVLFAGGVYIGYTDHHFARLWKTPFLGEQVHYGTDREGFVRMIQAHSPRPLPREFLDRNYDAFDRPTRCAILRLYRNMPDVSELGREHAEALRPHDRPALVIWGDRDVFTPAHMAPRQREAFPRADVHVFENSGHWPFVDEEERTVDLMSAFFKRNVKPPVEPGITVSVAPRRVRVGRRTRLSVRAAASGRPLPGATIRAAGRRARTDAAGRAALVVRPRRPGMLAVTASKPAFQPARQRVRVLPARRR